MRLSSPLPSRGDSDCDGCDGEFGATRRGPGGSGVPRPSGYCPYRGVSVVTWNVSFVAVDRAVWLPPKVPDMDVSTRVCGGTGGDFIGGGSFLGRTEGGVREFVEAYWRTGDTFRLGDWERLRTRSGMCIGGDLAGSFGWRTGDTSRLGDWERLRTRTGMCIGGDLAGNFMPLGPRGEVPMTGAGVFGRAATMCCGGRGGDSCRGATR
jgi:hypothetical protein